MSYILNLYDASGLVELNQPPFYGYFATLGSGMPLGSGIQLSGIPFGSSIYYEPSGGFIKYDSNSGLFYGDAFDKNISRLLPSGSIQNKLFVFELPPSQSENTNQKTKKSVSKTFGRSNTPATNNQSSSTYSAPTKNTNNGSTGQNTDNGSTGQQGGGYEGGLIDQKIGEEIKAWLKRTKG